MLFLRYFLKKLFGMSQGSNIFRKSNLKIASFIGGEVLNVGRREEDN